MLKMMRFYDNDIYVKNYQENIKNANFYAVSISSNANHLLLASPRLIKLLNNGEFMHCCYNCCGKF